MRRRVLFLAGLATLPACNDKAPPEARPTASPSATAVASGSTGPRTSADPSAASAAPTSAAPARPLYFDRAITSDDLTGRSLRELSLMRNTIYARAGNPFRRPWLKKHFDAQPWYEEQEQMDPSKLSALDRNNARAIADHDAALSREELEARRDEVLGRRQKGTPRPGDEVELSLLSQRLGEWLLEGERPPTPLEDPRRLDALLSVDDLGAMSRRDLRILRNTIYARRGRSFSSKVVQGYFKTTSWYTPRADYHDGLLSRVDQKNVALIRSVEDSLGGPLHENPNYGKEGWFIAA